MRVGCGGRSNAPEKPRLFIFLGRAFGQWLLRAVELESLDAAAVVARLQLASHAPHFDELRQSREMMLVYRACCNERVTMQARLQRSAVPRCPIISCRAALQRGSRLFHWLGVWNMEGPAFFGVKPRAFCTDARMLMEQRM